MSFPTAFLDELRSRLALSDVIAKRVKLTKKGREYTGLCPFHHEKTASFTVNNEKGFYHCFGCGAHGDIIKFMMDLEKLPFIEAVERLADMAGLKIPENSPQQKQWQQKHTTLLKIMEEACRFFQQNLFSPTGATAQQYLSRRGITPDIAKNFRLGYAPTGSKLTTYLKSKNIPLSDCAKLGLIVNNQQHGSVHDYFYDRVMFPILNRQGKVIAFGGRIMQKGEPKYLNSPETELFHKGEQLYALKHATPTIRQKNEAILVEGYMDVISLHAAGFTNAIAPLGTALTETQIRLLWTLCDEPIICFDGDRAGRGAAIRAMKRALPILTPGKSLRFAWLPDGLDPDDMIKKRSAEEYQSVLSGAHSMIETVWNFLLEGRSLNTPERLAKLEADAHEIVLEIQDKTVQNYYKKAFKKYLWALDKNKKKNFSFQNVVPILIPQSGLSEAKMLLAYLICYPKTCEKMIEEIGALHFPNVSLSQMAEQVITEILNNPTISSTDLQNALEPTDLSLLKDELEMLKKSHRSELEIIRELRERISDSKIHALKAEIQVQTEIYSQEPTAEKWAQILSLKESLKTEMEKQAEIE